MRPIIVRSLLALVLLSPLFAQDTSTIDIRVTVLDATGARIADAAVFIRHEETGLAREGRTDAQGTFAAALLPPGDYRVRASAPQMAPLERRIHCDVGEVVPIELRLAVAGAKETVEVAAASPLVESQPGGASTIIDERLISDLPINGRRFSDLALLSPWATTDPRSLTSASNGDLAFGGVRGVNSTTLVDGTDNNNGFFAQARGRYRAPYQFSNEVVREFRVSSNTYGAELGRSGGAVINIVTRSGENHLRGNLFYYLRDSRFNARHPFTDFKPGDRQHQFGFSAGGPIRRDRAFIFAGFDQHIFHVPTVVRFVGGASEVVPTAEDYETPDRVLVQTKAAELSQLAGEYRSELVGNAGFAKFDLTITPRHQFNARLSTSRYSGANNVYFDPASPVTYFAITDNGEELVATESASLNLQSALAFRWSSHARAQFSRDLQESLANSSDVRIKIQDILEGAGRSTILPRRTREHRLHFAETLAFEGRRQEWKFGGDALLTWTSNYFPLMFGGEHVYNPVRVNPFTYAPQAYGMWITPLRAYAHGVPRYYFQNFGSAMSEPNSTDFSLFAQDTVRIGGSLALSLGVRYDQQRLGAGNLQPNPLWPGSGVLPRDTNNLAPRLGIAWNLPGRTVLRGGFGLFYTRVPQIYASTAEVENGIARTHLFLDVSDPYQRVVFPKAGAPLADCPPGAAECVAPASVAQWLTSEISTFARDFQTPFVSQASLNLEREIGGRFAVGASYLYVHGQHLIRARDVNLPNPTVTTYPVFDQMDVFTGDYVDVSSFGNWEMRHTTQCAFPPCLLDVVRPIPEVGAINVFESAASSVYHGMTLSLRRRMSRGLYFRLGYTWAKSIDDGQDALVVGRPGNIENSAAPSGERALSAIDQRHRFVASWSWEPNLFHRERPWLGRLFNDWRVSGIVSAGSGRPVNARITGDPNRDGNTYNDRLPGYSRNAFTGPDYATTDLRLTRRFFLSERLRLEASAESFNVLNRNNKRVDITDDGWLATAGDFVPLDATIGTHRYPAYYRRSGEFLRPNNAYAPRQIQFSLRLSF